MLQERQQFHMEQIKAAEHRARQMAMQQLVTEQRSQGSTSDQPGLLIYFVNKKGGRLQKQEKLKIFYALNLDSFSFIHH